MTKTKTKKIGKADVEALPFSESEKEKLQQLADITGISVDEVADLLAVKFHKSLRPE